jgi:hypothetical protein
VYSPSSASAKTLPASSAPGDPFEDVGGGRSLLTRRSVASLPPSLARDEAAHRPGLRPCGQLGLVNLDEVPRYAARRAGRPSCQSADAQRARLVDSFYHQSDCAKTSHCEVGKYARRGQRNTHGRRQHHPVASRCQGHNAGVAGLPHQDTLTPAHVIPTEKATATRHPTNGSELIHLMKTEGFTGKAAFSFPSHLSSGANAGPLALRDTDDRPRTKLIA